MVQRARGNKIAISLLVAASIFLSSLLSGVQSVPLSRERRALRLCSRDLSDALYVICQKSGYNEPFSYSSEDAPRSDSLRQSDNSRGLVEECCYRSCTYMQLQQYCKPTPEAEKQDSRDVMEESYSIVNMPSYSSATRDLSEDSPRTGMDHTGGDAIKRKADHMKGKRHGGKSGLVGECRGKTDAKKRHRGRHCRCRRRRLECRRAGKVSHGNFKPLDNKFVMSSPADRPTTSFPITL